MKEQEKVYWVWLQMCLGAGSYKPKRILEYFPDLESFYEAGQLQWRSIGLFTPKELKALREHTIADGEVLLRECQSKGMQTLTPACNGYPERLLEIENPPCVLYVKGTLPDVDTHPALAVVGTRNATTTGKQIAFDLSVQLAQSGMVIVSGGAKGIDTAAHQGALQGGGSCICVLGCGLECSYLQENEHIRRQIAEQGAILSEFPFDTPALKHHFPIRNRIISGLSVGILVVEAAERSGSLITAAAALEQNRDVFAVPCGIYNPVSEGVNNLLKAGAKPVTKVQDILEEYSGFALTLKAVQSEVKAKWGQEDRMLYCEPATMQVKRKQESVQKAQPTMQGLSQDGALVLEKLTRQPVQMEQLEEITGLSAQRILIAVTELELCNAIVSHSGRRYSV